MAEAQNQSKISLKKYISRLSNQTQFTEEKIREWHESFHKSCPIGKANRQEFEQFYKDYYQNEDAGEFAAHVFRSIDKKDSNFVTFGELVCAGNVILNGIKEEKLRWMFTMYDLDDDSIVKRAEMYDIHLAAYKMVLGRNYAANPSHQVDFIFKNVDKNLDGILTFDEFEEGTQKGRAAARVVKI